MKSKLCHKLERLGIEKSGQHCKSSAEAKMFLIDLFLFSRKAAGKYGADKDAGSSTRTKREADDDPGEEVVFEKKPRSEAASANDLK